MLVHRPLPQPSPGDSVSWVVVGSRKSSVRRAAILAALVTFLAACGQPATDVDEPPEAEAEVEAGAGAAAQELPGASLDGEVTDGCVEGWSVPEPDSPLERTPLRVIRRTMRFDGELVPEEIRFFEGPESPPSGQGYLEMVERWYVRGSLEGDASFRGRWIVERRLFGAGVAAVAPYETQGYASPDWTGFQYTSHDLERREYDGLPGDWVGEPYDFVTGSEELDIRVRGLPDEVIGCLAGT